MNRNRNWYCNNINKASKYILNNKVQIDIVTMDTIFLPCRPDSLKYHNARYGFKLQRRKSYASTKGPHKNLQLWNKLKIQTKMAFFFVNLSLTVFQVCKPCSLCFIIVMYTWNWEASQKAWIFLFVLNLPECLSFLWHFRLFEHSFNSLTSTNSATDSLRRKPRI